MNASVVWHHGLSFTGTADSGFTVPIGASPDADGANDGLRPTELVLIGLAGCTGMDVISILRKQRQEVTGFEVKVQGRRAEKHPRVFTDIELEYVVQGRGVQPAAVAKAIELSESKYCSVMAMLARSATIRHGFRVVEEEQAPAGE